MSCRISVHVSVIVALMLSAGSSSVSADVIRLKNGGEVRGHIDRNTLRSDSKSFTIETLSGAIVIVDRKHLKFIVRRPLLVEEYETRAKLTADTVEAHWELAEWCTKNRLAEQHRECLQRIVDLEPENEKARLALGFTKYNGTWMTKDGIKRTQGFVRYKGRYITTQEHTLFMKSDAQRELEREWHKTIRLWKAWLNGKSPERRNDGLAELRNIMEPAAVPALMRYFQDSSQDQRLMYVSILSQIPGPRPVAALVEQSLKDSDHVIRDWALDAIQPRQFATAASHYLNNLKSDRNTIIGRAAVGLAKVGDGEAVPGLIDALVTTHYFRVKVPDRSNTYSFAADGSGTGSRRSPLPPDIEAKLRTGQLPYGVILLPPSFPGGQKMRVVRVKRTYQNSEVLAALKKLTGQSFGYDKRTWRLWLAAKSNGLVDTSTIP
ncbi:MAG: HEAT repeat domain-containing protein [Planctomycetes bacterium]|nr:HEAT repeat domain-containing protein [Planctomycetota bacterium]